MARFQREATDVTARRVERETEARDHEGRTMLAKAGEWIVEVGGAHEIMSDARFRAEYKPVDKAASDALARPLGLKPLGPPALATEADRRAIEDARREATERTST
jgi:hypothetical protein